MSNPKIEKYERLLAAMPSEFRQLASWGWTTLMPQLEAQALAAGATPTGAAVMAARLARMVCGQIINDIGIERATHP